MKFINTFDKHTKEPEKTVDAYIKEKKLELGEWVNQRRKVYLDTKFWLLLRDAHLDRAKEQSQYDLLKLTADAVSSGKIICPISEDVFQEVTAGADKSRCAEPLNKNKNEKRPYAYFQAQSC
ncbi:MAG: hypothetical protein AB9919_14480 [Geobacteraceae bacterium]